MVKSITIFKPNKEETFFAVGGKLVKNSKKTGTTITSIEVEGKMINIEFSDGELLTYYNMPYISGNK